MNYQPSPATSPFLNPFNTPFKPEQPTPFTIPFCKTVYVVVEKPKPNTPFVYNDNFSQSLYTKENPLHPYPIPELSINIIGVYEDLNEAELAVKYFPNRIIVHSKFKESNKFYNNNMSSHPGVFDFRSKDIPAPMEID